MPAQGFDARSEITSGENQHLILSAFIWRSFPACLRRPRRCHHIDFLMMCFLTWRGKNPKPSLSHLRHRSAPINRHTRAAGLTVLCIISCEAIPLTYIVLLFTRDRVAADFSVLYRCQVPEKKQKTGLKAFSLHHRVHSVTLALTKCCSTETQQRKKRKKKNPSSGWMNSVSQRRLRFNKHVKDREAKCHDSLINPFIFILTL